MLLLARLMRPLRWRSPPSTSRMLLAFARAERSSFYDMREAANATAELPRKMQLFRDELEALEGTPRADPKTRALLAALIEQARGRRAD